MRLKLLSVIALLCCLAWCFATDITRMEYYLDLDGSGGTPTILSFTGDSLAVGTGQIDLSGVAPGQHRLSVRVKDENNRWSQFAHRLVYRADLTAPALATCRYRFDSLPEQSLALSPLGPGLWLAEDEISFPPETSPGLHTLRTWVVDAQGRSSLQAGKLVGYLPAPQHSNITRLAWFFSGNEADPDQIYYHEVGSPQPDIIQDLVLTLPSLTPGLTYTLSFLALQEDGTPSLRATYSFDYDLTVDNLVISLDGNQILLAWDEVPGALHYLVETKDDPYAEGVWQQVPGNSYSTPATDEEKFFRVKVVK
jgi:hypothetical protein